jgi:hypothetical protein
MSTINTALSMASSPNYSIDQILQATQPAKQPGGFRRVLGAVVGGVGNVVAPGIGGLIGSAISGTGGINQSGLMGDTMQFLQLQRQMNMEQQAFETASAVMKARHDASMAAIRNIS